MPMGAHRNRASVPCTATIHLSHRITSHHWSSCAQQPVMIVCCLHEMLYRLHFGRCDDPDRRADDARRGTRCDDGVPYPLPPTAPTVADDGRPKLPDNPPLGVLPQPPLVPRRGCGVDDRTPDPELRCRVLPIEGDPARRAARKSAADSDCERGWLVERSRCRPRERSPADDGGADDCGC